MKLLVVGGGVAGAAAAHRAVTSGIDCSWLLGGLGATSASSGVLDWCWERGQSEQRTLTASERAFVDSYGWQLPEKGVCVASCDGAIRRAAGCDAAVLDLERARGGVVLVIDLPRPGWDAQLMCRGLSETVWARTSGTRFVPLSLDAAALGPIAEMLHDAGDLEFARAVTEDASALLAALTKALAGAERARAVLFGPWLCTDARLTQELSGALSIPVGETTSPAFGVAGARFETSRQRWLEACGVQHRPTWLESLRVEDRRVVAAFGSEQREFDAAVLAIGGVSGGGLALDEQNQVRVSAELIPPAQLRARQLPLLSPGSMWGLEYQALGPELFEAIGLQVAVRERKRLALAGDVEPDLPRTMLQAMRSGGSAAARLLPR